MMTQRRRFALLLSGSKLLLTQAAKPERYMYLVRTLRDETSARQNVAAVTMETTTATKTRSRLASRGAGGAAEGVETTTPVAAGTAAAAAAPTSTVSTSVDVCVRFDTSQFAKPHIMCHFLFIVSSSSSVDVLLSQRRKQEKREQFFTIRTSPAALSISTRRAGSDGTTSAASTKTKIR